MATRRWPAFLAWAAAAAALVLGAGALWRAGAGAARAPVRAALTVAEALGGDAEAGWLRADAPRPFAFPADHGPHPGFRTEWWYWTGNLAGDDGRRFGYQLTFFRAQLAPHPPLRASAWAAPAVWMAHLALTDVAAGAFHADERFAREALGLAGARATPWTVWLEDWRAEPAAAAGPDGWPLRLRATGADGCALDVTLAPQRSPVLQGDAGLSRKGRGPGNASYYYSQTRLATRGTLRAGGREHAVAGLSWLDREWSTSALDSTQAGWDWFALHLDDGADLMLYRLRRRDGSTDPHSAGTLVARDGTVTRLAAADFTLEESGRWRSAATGAEYPAAWRIAVSAAGVTLAVRPLVADQEHRGAFVYWEGCVEATGSRGSAPLRGSGYAELTGYAPPTPGRGAAVAGITPRDRPR